MKLNHYIILLFLFNLIATCCWGQRILLDQPVRAGEVTFFPDLKEPNNYYYLPDKAGISYRPDGTPEFSFFRYVEGDKTKNSSVQTIREGTGGGIVHMVVELAVPEDMLEEGKRKLRSINRDAVVKGPAIYESGKFALVSSFVAADGDLSTQVIGVGAAPVLDGHKAAVSLQLTKQGAKLLWEIFKTPTPDVSFSFEMTLGGFLSPIEAKLEADFDQIYKHQAFDVGLATPVLQAEVKGAFDELTRSGAIKYTGVEADEKMERLIEIAYQKLTEMMMEPMTTSTTDLSQLVQQQSMLDKASEMLKSERAASDRRNREIRRRNDRRDQQARNTSNTTSNNTTEEEQQNNTEEENNSEEEQNTETEENNEEEGNSTENNEEEEQNTEASTAGENSRATDDNNSSSNNSNGNNNNNREQEESSPSIAIAASYRMKEVKMKGKFEVSFNKYMQDTKPFTFVENIGEIDCKECFHEVNLDEIMFFKQRDIRAFLDGLNSSDFENYINYVTVMLTKPHQNGKNTSREIMIDRTKFNNTGNYYTLSYGINGDTSYDDWLKYDYEILWSFFGDLQVKEPKTTTYFNGITLSPPYKKRTLELQADPELLKGHGVRLITVNVYYKLDGKEYQVVETINPTSNIYAKPVNYTTPANKYEYEYEITWRLSGGKTVESGRKTGDSSILFVDEIPEK